MKRSIDEGNGARHLAVLIDADNAQASVLEGLLAEIAKYGQASVKRIYGDFTSQRLQSWRQLLLKHSVQLVKQFAYTSGKNATDSALIIDAMDLMYTGRFDGFCLVSSDSDFTRLTQRLREAGLAVDGFGERKTPDPFVQACDRFVYTEVLRAAESAPIAFNGKSKAPVAKAKDATPKQSAANEAGLRALLAQAVEDAVEDEDGWVTLTAVGSYLANLRPDFDPRLYGQRKLSALIAARPKWFEIEHRGAEGSRQYFVRSRLTR